MKIIICCGAVLLAASTMAATAIHQRAGIPFVDAHIHLNNPDSAMALLETAGITSAVVFIGAQGTNDDVLAAARQSNGRLIPFASISPERRDYRGRWLRDDTAVVAELDRMLAGGEFRGIGEISVVHFGDDLRPGGRGGFPETEIDPTGRVMRGIMTVAQRRALPVMIHCEVTRLRELGALLEAFPDVRVIWAHGGYTPLVLASRMLDRHPNLTYELSARTWSNHPRSPDYTIFRNDSVVWPGWIQLIERHSGRFIVGTDATLRSLENDRRKADRVSLLLSQLSDSTRNRVASGNITRLTSR